MNAPVQQRDRKTYIGGAAISSILGVNPYRTALELYWSMVGETDPVIDEEKARFFRRRKRQEPIVAEILADEMGYEITRLSTDLEPNRYQDPAVPYFAAEIDYELRTNRYSNRDHVVLEQLDLGTLCNGEIKTVHPLAAADFGEDGSDKIPPYYTAQVLWGLGVTGRPAAMLSALIGVDELRNYPILRDEETIAWMREQAHAFWNDHIVPRVPPPPSTLEDARKLFLRFNGRPVDLDEDVAALDALARLSKARADKKAAEDAAYAAETDLALAIAKAWQVNGPDETADNAVLRAGGVDLATWKLQPGSYLDQKRLAVERPEIVAEFKQHHVFRVVRFIKPKKVK